LRIKENRIFMNCGGHLSGKVVRQAAWLWAASLLLTGLGAKLWLIHKFSTPLPFWDQWEDARVVFAPYFEGKLSLAALFSPHNEPRIFFTRVYDLVLLLLNGQWDGELLMVLNAMIHCAIIAGLGLFMTRSLEMRYWTLIWLPLVLALALPFAWENTLAGFHSMFYFLLLFTLLTIWLLGSQAPGSPRWRSGVLAAVMALFTLSSGFLAVWAALGWITIQVWRAPQNWKRQVPVLAVWAVLTIAGVMLKANVKHHQALQAHSLAEFATALGSNLAWPWIVLPPFAPANLFALVALAWFVLRAEEDCRPAEGMTLGIGLWVVLQGAAAAYARGAGGKGPGWRYMDSNSLILAANCFAIAFLLQNHLRANRFKIIWRLAFILWGIACCSGLALLTARAWRIDIPERRFEQYCQLLNARAYMATGDIRVLDRKPHPQLPLYEGDPDAPKPHHEGDKFVRYLSLPRIRDILPACVRDPLHVAPEHVVGFVTNAPPSSKPRIVGEVIWTSSTAGGTTNKGRFESRPMTRARFPFLEFRIAGDLGKPGLSLSLLELGSGKTIAVKPDRPPGHTWQTCRVRAPRGDFKLIAVDESSSGWFAFQPPRELAGLSWAADGLAAAGGFLFMLGVALYGMGVVLALGSRNGVGPDGSPASPAAHLSSC
jgi:hypothetical protein